MKKITIILIILCVLFSTNFVSADIQADPEIYTKLVGHIDDNGEIKEIEIPLKHTSVKSNITGYINKVEVEQEYENNFENPIEAVYIFPLPENAAINSMEMIIGKRVIKAIIKEKEEAKKTYEQAKREGKRTSLLDQERPNIFTQSVANILPGDKIIIKISYIETLEYDNGKYTFTFPMVVGPRYIPKKHEDAMPLDPVSTTKENQDLNNKIIDKVIITEPINRRNVRNINPPILPPNTRSGHDISLQININTQNITITNLKSNTHDVSINKKSEYEATINLSQLDNIPNKDFVFSYNVVGELPQYAIYTSKENGKDGYFTLMVQPPTNFTENDILPKEIIFIVDVSGSMGGVPINLVKKAMEYSIQNLNPNDTFNLYLFANTLISYSPETLLATNNNIEKAVEYIRNIQSGGGTEMMPAIKAAADGPLPIGKIRIVSIMTDGQISNDDEVLETIQNTKSDQIRWFPFSIGPAPNRYLLDRMSDIGRGKAFYVGENDKPEKVIDDFYSRIDSPVYINLNLNWGGLEVYDIFPKYLPDLFIGEPLYVHGRYKNSGNFNVTLNGLVSSVEGGSKTLIEQMKKFTLRDSISSESRKISSLVNFPTVTDKNNGISSIWARYKIKKLMNDLRVSDKQDNIIKQITNVGIEHSLMTNYTSFVAVEEKIVLEPGQVAKTIEVPVELPSGTTYEGYFGDNIQYSKTVSQAGSGLSTGALWGGATIETAGVGYSGLSKRDPRGILLGVLRIFASFLLLIGIIPFIVFGIYFAINKIFHKDLHVKKWLLITGGIFIGLSLIILLGSELFINAFLI